MWNGIESNHNRIELPIKDAISLSVEKLSSIHERKKAIYLLLFHVVNILRLTQGDEVARICLEVELEDLNTCLPDAPLVCLH